MDKKRKERFILIYIPGILLLFIVLLLIYFSLPTIVTPDSIGYYNYLKIFQGDVPLSSWNPVRGPNMPLIIYVIVSIFGDTSFGFLIGTFIFFIVTVVIGYFIIYEVFRYKSSKTAKILVSILFVVLFVFNPLIIGYYHVMLTEFVAATVAMLCCLLSIKWINIEIDKSFLKFLFYSLAFIFLSVFMWFVKQPYVITVLFPLILGTFLSIYKLRNLKNTFLKLFVVVLCFTSIIIGISVWDSILISNSALSSASWNKDSLSRQLMAGVSNFDEISSDNLSENDLLEWSDYLNSREMELIKKIKEQKTEYSGYKLYKVLSIRESVVIDIVVVPMATEEGDSFKDVMLFFNVVIREYPQHVLASYFSNYLAIINLTHLDHTNYVPIKRYLKFSEAHGENEMIGLAVYYSYSSVLGNLPAVMPYAMESFPQYVREMNPNEILLKPVFRSLIRSSLLFLTIVLLVAPFLFIFFLYTYLFKSENRLKQRDTLYESIIILFGYSFLHVLLHSFLGAVVDRYAFPAYPTAIVGLLLLLALISKKGTKGHL